MRALFTALRRLMQPQEKQKADDSISCSVLALPQWQKAETVCLYMSMPDEVDTKPLLAAALNAEKTVVSPRVEGKTLVLQKVASVKDFIHGTYHILEPKKSCKIISPDTVDLFIVPGVAFDQNANRLGRGFGYYDRLLAGNRAVKIGLAYEAQVIAELAATSYDVPMTMVVTEEQIICR